MSAGVPPGFAFSQSNLRDYLECRRRFQWRHLERRPWPALRTPEAAAWEEAIARGRQFHLLLHQAAIGLDVSDQVTDAPPDVRRWWEAWIAHPLRDLPAARIFSELTVSVPVGDFALVARFDRLLLADDGRAMIVDWKTDTRVPAPSALAVHVQTIIYRYVLVEGAPQVSGGQPIEPGDVTLTYWYAEQPAEPIRLAYSDGQHRQARAQIRGWIQEIAGLSADQFHRTTDQLVCRRCEYRALCNKGSGSAMGWIPDEEVFENDVPGAPDW